MTLVLFLEWPWNRTILTFTVLLLLPCRLSMQQLSRRRQLSRWAAAAQQAAQQAAAEAATQQQHQVAVGGGLGWAGGNNYYDFNAEYAAHGLVPNGLLVEMNCHRSRAQSCERNNNSNVTFVDLDLWDFTTMHVISTTTWRMKSHLWIFLL